MTTHRVRRRPITRSDGETFEPGDEIDATDAELAAFGDNLIELEDQDTSTDAGEGADDEEEAETDGEAAEATVDEADLADVLDGTIGDVEEELATGEYDDVLDQLEALEEDGEARRGVFDALDDRRESGGDGE